MSRDRVQAVLCPFVPRSSDQPGVAWTRRRGRNDPPTQAQPIAVSRWRRAQLVWAFVKSLGGLDDAAFDRTTHYVCTCAKPCRELGRGSSRSAKPLGPVVAASLVVMVVSFMSAGCASDPFDRSQLGELSRQDAVDPRAAVDAFAASLPRRYVSEDTVVIDSLVQDLTVLGFLKVDESAGTFTLMGLNPAGLELFVLSGIGDSVKIESAVPPLLERREVLESLGRDIRRIFFDWQPGPEARATVTNHRLWFTQGMLGDTMTHVYGGQPIQLIRKRRNQWFGPHWHVAYDQWQRDETSSRLRPGRIVFDNHRYHYRLTIDNRSWQISDRP